MNSDNKEKARAEALRNNLKKRKQQSSARKQSPEEVNVMKHKKTTNKRV